MKIFVTIFSFLIALSLNSCFTPNSEAIERIRQKIIANAKDYSESDVSKVRTSSGDDFIKLICEQSSDETQAINLFDFTFKWRKSHIRTDAKDDYFPLEVYKVGWITYMGKLQSTTVFLVKLSSWK